jgi:2-polyprenyl-6-methoxyphenol hydroxylase-like FAD-dependent oxidoreductase
MNTSSHTKGNLESLSKATNGSSHAITIGGGIAGLLAARVLTDFFDKVTVIERDCFAEVPQPRKGVPQSHHPHVLLVQGQNIIEQLLPGIRQELIRKGALSLDWAADFRWLLLGNWTPRFSSDIIGCACTRNLLEATVRQFLVNDGKVDILEGHQVTGLVSSQSRTSLRGIRVLSSQGKEHEINAQLILDASGRSSKSPQWLQHLGYEKPQQTSVKSFLGYSTRWYRNLNRESQDYKLLYVMPQAPDLTRGAVMHLVEGDRLLVNLIGVGGDYPPTDEAGFLEFARSLASSEVYKAIVNAEPISPIYGYRRTDNRLYHYEKLTDLPENFILLGDAVCAFNPVYGQGISSAALGAQVLSQCLQKWGFRTGFSKHFQKQLAKVNHLPWLIATGDDFRWSTTEGTRPNFLGRLMQRYLDHVMAAASESADVYHALVQVLHLLKPPVSLLQPSVIGRSLLPKKIKSIATNHN